MDYKRIWSDEFNVDGPPDPAKWTFEEGFVRNEELQWYQPANARCEQGFLIIEARKEERPNPWFDPNKNDWRSSRKNITYTSTSLKTQGLHAWQYGRFEMRAKIDTRPGLWPAFWTLGVQGEWPSNGEIDIMEYYRGMLLANFAWGTNQRWTARWKDLKKPISEFADPEWPNQFHLWRMDWTEEKIQLFVDDILMNEVELSETVNGDWTDFNPFHQPHYLLVNLAIGGQNGGDPSGTEFPARLEVDYIRVYQK